MTISSNAAPKAGPFNGNGVQTVFPFTFHAFAKADLLVVSAVTVTGVQTTLVLDSNYSVALNVDQSANPGGSVTYPISGTPLPVGSTLTIVSDIDYTQILDLINGGGFYPDVLEDSLDRGVMQGKQILEIVSRTLQVAVSTPANVSVTLPAPSASQLIGWNGTATGLVNYVPDVSSAAGLQIRLADTTSASNGPGLVHASQSQVYAYDTLGGHFNYHPAVKDHPWHAIGDGVTNDGTAISNATVAALNVRFPPGVYAIDQDYTLPRNASWLFEQGARILVKAGRTVTLLGKIVASEDQWIFDCADTPTNFSDPNNYLGGGAVTTTTPIVLGGSYYAAGGFSGAVSVKWFGATGAGYTDPSLLTPYEASQTIPSNLYADDTKAIRFALTAICGDYNNIDQIGSQRGATGLFFPDGDYTVNKPLYFGGIALYGRTKQSPVLGCKITQVDVGEHGLVVQSAGRGGLGGGGSSSQINNLTLCHRFSSFASTKHTVHFVENKFCLDAMISGCRFSNSPNGGATIGWDKKEARAASSGNISGGTTRYGYGTAEGLTVTMHIQGCMFDVGFRVFEVGTYGSGEIEVSDTSFFDFRTGLIYDPAKDLTAGRADNGGSVQLWMKGCEFQDIGQFYGGATGGQPDQNFLYSRNAACDYTFFGCKYMPETRAQYGGSINMGGGSLTMLSNTWDQNPTGTNPTVSLFLRLSAAMGTVRLQDNKIRHRSASIPQAWEIANDWAPADVIISGNAFTVNSAVQQHIFINNPATLPTGAALFKNNFFSTCSVQPIVGNFQSNIVFEGNIFATPQDPKGQPLLNYGMKGRTEVYVGSIPVAGTWFAGDRAIRTPPAVGSPKAWSCTVSGTPGTWVSEGNL